MDRTIQATALRDAIIVEASGDAWAVKHNTDFIGYAWTRAEAVIVAQDLRDWMEERGRPTDLVVERGEPYRYAGAERLLTTKAPAKASV